MADKTIILARPHPFIAKDMRAFLDEQGYTPHPIHDTNELALLADRNVVGAIISTSVISEVDEDHIGVYHKIRKIYPNLPIMFATLANPTDLARPLRTALEKDGAEVTILEVESASVFNRGLGSPNTFVIIHKNCLTKPEGKEMAARMVAHHFK